MDLVAAFVLENTTKAFENSTYHGIYRDDGLIVLKGEITKKDVID